MNVPVRPTPYVCVRVRGSEGGREKGRREKWWEGGEKNGGNDALRCIFEHSRLQQYTCTAVYNHGSSLLVVGFHSADHGQHGCGILWHSMVWPGGEMELANLTGILT